MSTADLLGTAEFPASTLAELQALSGSPSRRFFINRLCWGAKGLGRFLP